MSVASVYQTRRRRAPITRFGALFLATANPARKLLDVCRGAFEDVSGCLAESRTHDAQHDAALALADTLAERGVQLALVSDAPQLAARYQAIRRAIRTAQAADADEDRLIDAAWCVARRLAGAIGRALTLRKQARP